MESRGSTSLTLRPIQEKDIEHLSRWGRDDQFCAAAEWTPGLSLADLTRFWEQWLGAPPQDVLRLLVVDDRDSPIGYVDLHGSDPDRRELGFVIGDIRDWGKGLGRLAASLMLNLAFDDLALTTVTAEAWDANGRSIRILQGLGFRETGQGETGIWLGQPTVYRQFEITASEWEVIRQRD